VTPNGRTPWRAPPPRILGISTYTETHNNGLHIARLAKAASPQTVVVIGGPHASVLYKEVALDPAVDVVVRGEGERTMLELAHCLIRGQGGLADVQGIAYQENGVLRTTAARPPIADLDELPYPARDLFPMQAYGYGNTVLASRGGCPFACHFCAVNNIWQGKRRFRSPESVLEEIVQVLVTTPMGGLNFADDTFTLDRRRVLEICKGLSRMRGPFPLRWRCATRVDLVDAELLREMRHAGCRSIQFGVEAGSQRILDAIGKRVRLEQVRRAVAMTLNYGIEVTCSFMFPHPEDTEETVRDQIRLMKELREIEGVSLTLAMTTPYPGTTYYERASELGLSILASDWQEYDAKHLVVATRHLTEERLQALLAEMVQEVGLQSALQANVAQPGAGSKTWPG